MRKTTRDGNTGIRWKFSGFLEDLDFADDPSLISSKRGHIQTNSPTNGKVHVDERELEEVLKFVYLGEQ